LYSLEKSAVLLRTILGNDGSTTPTTPTAPSLPSQTSILSSAVQSISSLFQFSPSKGSPSILSISPRVAHLALREINGVITQIQMIWDITIEKDVIPTYPPSTLLMDHRRMTPMNSLLSSSPSSTSTMSSDQPETYPSGLLTSTGRAQIRRGLRKSSKFDVPINPTPRTSQIYMTHEIKVLVWFWGCIGSMLTFFIRQLGYWINIKWSGKGNWLMNYPDIKLRWLASWPNLVMTCICLGILWIGWKFLLIMIWFCSDVLFSNGSHSYVHTPIHRTSGSQQHYHNI